MGDYEYEELKYDIKIDLIIEYIRNNDCRSKEQVIRAVSKSMARVTALKILDLLEETGIIVTYTASDNARDKRVILDKSHIFFTVFNELNLVEQIFGGLSKKILDKLDSLENKYSNDEFSVDYKTKYTQISSLPYELYFKIAYEYLTRCLLDWPYKINNSEVLKILNGLLFTKLNNLQNKIQQSAIMLNMSKNTYNYLNREEMSFPVIGSIKKIDLDDFTINLNEKDNDKYIDLFLSICSIDENDSIDEDEDDYLNDVNTNTLSEDDKLIEDSQKLEKLYKKYPYPHFDIEEYHEIENDDDNIDKQKK
jgi:hypothetical protein